MLDDGAGPIVNQVVPVRDFHAARPLRLYFRRMLVGADQRDIAARGIGAAMPGPLDIGKPQPTGEQRHHEKSQCRTKHAVRPRRGFLVTPISKELGSLIGIDRSEMIGHGYISCTGSTPMTARPEAMTMATPRTRARRAWVSAGSEPTMKRNVASSLPLFHSM